MFMGLWTQAELADLVKSTDYNVKQVQDAYDGFKTQWQIQDSTTEAAWSKDWDAFKARYSAARLAAGAALLIPHPGIKDSIFPTDTPYKNLLVAMTKTPGHWTDTDYQGLYTRLQAVHITPISFADEPQPGANDADNNLRNALGAVDVVAGVKHTFSGADGKLSSWKVGLGVAAGTVLVVGLAKI